MKRLGLAFFVMALMLCANVNASVTCYVCSGSSACNQNLDINTQSLCTVCKKTEANGMVTRSCDRSLYIIFSRSCTTSGGVKECYCDSDYCNYSSRTCVSMATLVFAFVAGFFLN